MVSKASCEQSIFSRIVAKTPVLVASSRRIYWLQRIRDSICYMQQVSASSVTDCVAFRLKAVKGQKKNHFLVVKLSGAATPSVVVYRKFI